MTDLTTEYMGLKLRSPIILASGGPGARAEMIRRAEDMGVGAVAMKGTYDIEAMWQSPTPRFRIIRRSIGSHTSSTFYCYEQGTGITAEEYPKEIERAKKACSIPIFANLVCQTPASWQKFVRDAQGAGADAIEVNVSCPHGSVTTLGGDIERNITEVLGLVMEVARVPISLKLSPQLTSPLGVALAAERCGAKSAVLFNRATGLEIDLDAERPIMHGGYAGHGGTWAIHYVLRWLSEIYPRIKIDLCASGGVVSGDDVAKCILAGAKTVELVSAVYLEGYEVLKKITGDLAKWMKKKGYGSPDEFRGKVCSRIVSLQDVDRRKKYIAAVDPRAKDEGEEKCKRCGKCKRVCIYEAVYEKADRFIIDPEKCVGCGLCEQICPADAIELIPIK